MASKSLKVIPTNKNSFKDDKISLNSRHKSFKSKYITDDDKSSIEIYLNTAPLNKNE